MVVAEGAAVGPATPPPAEGPDALVPPEPTPAVAAARSDDGLAWRMPVTGTGPP